MVLVIVSMPVDLLVFEVPVVTSHGSHIMDLVFGKGVKAVL